MPHCPTSRCDVGVEIAGHYKSKGATGRGAPWSLRRATLLQLEVADRHAVVVASGAGIA
jgi:hypothetical protein